MTSMISANSSIGSRFDPITSIGIYLDAPGYDQTTFALLEQAEEPLEQAFPGTPWEAIDSTATKVRTLPFPLPVLGRLISTPSDSQAVRLAAAIGTAYSRSHLLVIRPGGAKPGRDSVARFEESAIFVLVECASGRTVFRRELKVGGQSGGRSSAQAAWAEEAWQRFVKAWKERPEGR
jgi:hypothetical protein